MIKNSIIYRRLWYMKRRNSRNLYIYFRLLSIVIILVLSIFYAQKYSIPYITYTTEQNIKSLIRAEVQNVLLSYASEEESNGESVNDNEIKGKIYTLTEGDSKLDGIERRISDRLEEKLDILDSEGIKLPMGSLLGNTALSSSGPDISLKSRLCEKVESQVKTKAFDMGEDRIEQGLYVYVKVKVGITMLLRERVLEIKTSVPIAGEAGIS